MAGNPKCAACYKTVYMMERIDADGKAFHKPCLKCSACKVLSTSSSIERSSSEQATLTLGTYVATEGKMMCKPCYMKGFLVKGNYSDGTLRFSDGSLSLSFICALPESLIIGSKALA